MEVDGRWIFLFNWVIFRFHVHFPRSKCLKMSVFFPCFFWGKWRLRSTGCQTIQLNVNDDLTVFIMGQAGSPTQAHTSKKNIRHRILKVAKIKNPMTWLPSQCLHPKTLPWKNSGWVPTSLSSLEFRPILRWYGRTVSCREGKTVGLTTNEFHHPNDQVQDANYQQGQFFKTIASSLNHGSSSWCRCFMVVVQSRHIPNGFVYVCIGSSLRAPGFQWQNKGLVRDSRNLIKHVSWHPGSFCFLDGWYRSKMLIFHVNLSTRVSMGASNW